MASKKLSKKQLAAKKRRQKRNAAKKIEFKKQLLFKSFDDMRNKAKKPVVLDFGFDSFEFILADDRFNQALEIKRKREILFRSF